MVGEPGQLKGGWSRPGQTLLEFPDESPLALALTPGAEALSPGAEAWARDLWC